MRYFSGLFAIFPPFLGYAVGVCEIFLHKISVRVSPPGRCRVRVSRYSPPSFLIAPRAAVSSSSPDAPFMARKLPPTFTSGRQYSASTGRSQIELLPPDLAGGFLGALLGKLYPGQTQLGAGVLQKFHPLAGGLHEGQFQLRLEDLGHDARKACPGTHVHHAPGYFRLAGKQQAVEEVLILDALRVGDGGQVDLLVVVYKDLGKGVQLIQLGAGEGDVPCGTLFL